MPLCKYITQLIVALMAYNIHGGPSLGRFLLMTARFGTVRRSNVKVQVQQNRSQRMKT